ncbi:MAG: hypothetical protein ABSE49_29895, partial [Polyangiaceae bacterium]
MVSASGCGASGAGSVDAKVELVGELPLGLALGSIASINGTYGSGCVARSGAWSAIVSGGQPQYPLLSVVTGNAACRLTLVSIVADQTYSASPPLELTSGYQASGSALAPVSEGGAASVAFYANAALSDATFADDFTISLLYSSNPFAVSGTATASFGTVS